MKVPEVRFVQTDGVRLAWAQFGSGPDVLIIPPLVSNVELAWEHEFFRRFLEYIGRHVRVTSFDKRGIGLSDKVRAAPTLLQRTDEIAAVMGAAGLTCPAVLGVSEGGLMAQLFAAQHPARVEKLVLVNAHPGVSGFVAAHCDEEGTFLPLEAAILRYQALIETWGDDPQYFVDWFVPSHAGDAAFVRWMGRFQRQSATASDLRRQLESLQQLDAVDHLARISAPTLIIHTADDPVMPIAAGRYLADRIPGATLIEVPGADHLAELTPGWQHIADTWLEFVTGSRPAGRGERRLATVLFTDIVGSTSRSAEAGDARWRRLLDRHDRRAEEIADRHRGTIVKSTGDGLLAHFDAPSAALQFAVDFREALSELDLTLRCGVHTGEIEVRDDGDITGTAVNVAARVMGAADGGCIFVSSTVVDLLLGGDVSFHDRGEHQLKGFERPWRLYELAV